MSRICYQIWSGEALATAAIEGEQLDLEAVRSSVVRRLGIEGERKGRVNRDVDGLIDVMEDATRHFDNNRISYRAQKAAQLP